MKFLIYIIQKMAGFIKPKTIFKQQKKVKAMTDEKKTIRKLTIEITDQDALLAAYPALEIKVEKTIVDRKKLRPIVNALHGVGASVPGVKAYYAADVADTDTGSDDAVEII